MPEVADKSGEMHFAIRFVTKYEYDAEVVDNINALRVRPAANSRQRLDDFTIRLTPDARQYRHEDYFGTEVVEFEVVRPHRELVVDVRARVTTQSQPEPSGTTWEALSEPDYCEAGGEYLLQTDDAPGNELLAALSAEVANTPTPLAAAMAVTELIPDRLEYRQGATYVDSALIDALEARAGVCQDFVHLGLNLLRRHGIAARYVSGYLFTTGRDEDDEDPRAESVEVDTHAWIEALLPRDEGEPLWVSIDPTNGGLAGENHVKIGHGRTYSDIPPVKGVYRGAANAELEASVTMTRSEGPDPASAARA
jgi:transglutaminase-like putative cysteine protease